MDDFMLDSCLNAVKSELTPRYAKSIPRYDKSTPWYDKTTPRYAKSTQRDAKSTPHMPNQLRAMQTTQREIQVKIFLSTPRYAALRGVATLRCAS
jgi:hypothetical protein